MEINFAMFTAYKWQYQITRKQMLQILRFLYFNDDF